MRNFETAMEIHVRIRPIIESDGKIYAVVNDDLENKVLIADSIPDFYKKYGGE